MGKIEALTQKAQRLSLEAWLAAMPETLPAHVKAAVVALVQTATNARGEVGEKNRGKGHKR